MSSAVSWNLIRRGTVVVLLACVAAETPAGAQPSAPSGYEPVLELMSSDAAVRARTLKRLKRSPDSSLVPGLVDAAFFAPKSARPDVYSALEALAGKQLGPDYYAWVEHVGAETTVVPKPGYAEWKRMLFGRIDAAYLRLLAPTLPRRIRLEEVVWGGVKFDAIPSLDAPAMISASEAVDLQDDETVYGLDLGGEQRAYPDRALSWHELTNDTVGGRPVAIIYCTLCGSAIAYSTSKAEGGAFEFGTSGLLFRSNKLMFDRATLTLWNSMTGKPVLGFHADRELELPILPMTRTRWADWRRLHPATKVMALDRALGTRHGYVYEPGAAERRRAGVSFPVWQKSDRLPRNEEVYGLRAGDAAKAYPLSALYSERVVNDVLGEQTVLLVADPRAGSVRAYLRGAHLFAAGRSPELLLDELGRAWRLSENNLTREGAGPTDVEALDRLPGHVAFWFGWFGFFPHTQVYGDS